MAARAERRTESGACIPGDGLAVAYRPVADLIPYARNARTHSEPQVALIAGSIREYGFTNPVLDDGENGIIAGHGRVLAARKIGLSQVPVIELAHLTEAQKRAYILADNRLAEQAGWDRELLALEAGDLADLGIDLGSLGFEAGEIDALLKSALADPREEEIPEVPAEPVSRPGDLWILGRHRLICGDATNRDTVARVLDGITPHLLVSDPPYGVMYDPGWRNRAGASETKRVGKVLNDDRADWREAWALFPGDVAYVWHGALHASTVAESLAATGFDVRSQIIWAKERLVLSRGHYHWQHEPCWYAVRKGAAGHWSGDRKQTTLWQIPSRDQDAETVHGTQKPVECMRRPILNNSSPGQAIYEPFCGSGSTLIAAETTGRACHAVELDPAYVDVAVTRWQAFTGKEAVLEGEDRSFAEVAQERRGGRP
ncbi:site-specific DNA-methyltransferase [Defluviimonas sp. WL0002]|uniref:Methyltransferase n=1 Tax=Albidovulum marisflavi TaxID=2984159 RepID=A0ABT2ZFK2_9RHOB|nr:site-specific DNA-methyltransferase [Defluviimonas sp. WL0002]MCV2869912.1 site-specific DNA-methyltransferase [Defluviimonas sp. WL0002]